MAKAKTTKPKPKKAKPKKRAAPKVAKVAQAETANTPATDPKAHLWKPGQSGNPNGRPKVVGEVRDIAREHTADAMNTLVAIMKKDDAPAAARVAAAAHVLDRGYGKPAQTINATVRKVGQMTDDELLSYLTGIDETNSSEGAAEAPGHPGLVN